MEVYTLEQKAEIRKSFRQLNETLPIVKVADPMAYDFLLSILTDTVVKHNPNVILTTSDTSPVRRYLNRTYGVPSVEIKDVVFNDPATIVIWNDGSKTVVKCQPGDVYSKETGLALCIAKKFLGNKSNFNNVFKKWIPEEVEPVEEISVDEMRKFLKDFCFNRYCRGCPLEDFPCDRAYHFYDSRRLTDDEIRKAYAVVFKRK